MGIPYSRQINAAFEQVTPLVAAGYAVLRTTRDISILLAVIQVLTVVLLALILVVLGMVLVCVDQDLEFERQHLITPLLRTLLHFLMSISLRGIIKSLLTSVVVCAVGAGLVWRFLLARQWVEDVEYEANVDAERALEEMDGEGDGGKEGKKEGSKDGGKGKGKK